MNGSLPRYLQLFRVLLPTWRFFDRPFTAPELFFGLKVNDHGPAIYENAEPVKTARRWIHLFLNPSDSIRFSYHSLLDQWVDEIESGIREGVSYELVLKYLEGRIGDKAGIEIDHQESAVPDSAVPDSAEQISRQRNVSYEVKFIRGQETLAEFIYPFRGDSEKKKIFNERGRT